MSTEAPTPREAILARVRTALRDVPPVGPEGDTPPPRDYRTSDPAPRAEVVALFVERVADYRAVVRRVTPSELPRAIAEACARQGIARLVAPGDLPRGWEPEGIALLRDPGLTIDQIETCDGVLTACALGIAQTGTIVLDSGPGQGRRVLTLLPDYHLCVVLESQIVSLVPEAVARLEVAASAPGRPITFISGPSATSDIELNRVEGVHGPRTLEVLVVDDAERHGKSDQTQTT
ncbi:MAG: LUD domain-containing protein [Isosphaeraceae bacterium]